MHPHILRTTITSHTHTHTHTQGDDLKSDFAGRHARQGGVGGAQMNLTNRNLRIREDTPKYLRNLDLNSAHYDPKARSMRANPYEGMLCVCIYICICVCVIKESFL